MPDRPSDPRDNVSNDLAVLQQILGLHGGQLDNFHPTRPPSAVRRFLTRATLEELQGTLVELLAAIRKR